MAQLGRAGWFECLLTGGAHLHGVEFGHRTTAGRERPARGRREREVHRASHTPPRSIGEKVELIKRVILPTNGLRTALLSSFRSYGRMNPNGPSQGHDGSADYSGDLPADRR